ncbi:recombinase family protein [Bacillus cereus]
MNSLAPSGKLTVQMFGIVSEIERDNIVASVKNGMKQRAKNGLWNSIPPFGYDIVNKKLVVNPEEAKVVQMIFEMYIKQNKGFKAITNYLNKLGYRTKANNLWSTIAVRDKLQNPIYAGFVKWGEYQNYASQRRQNPNSDCIFVKGVHERIIDELIWQEAKEKMGSSQKPIRIYENEFLLSGILKCPSCHGSMVSFRRKNKKTGQIYRYYECYNAKRKGTVACSHNLINADYAEKLILEKLKEYITNPLIIKDVIKKRNKQNTTSLKPFQLELSSIDKNILKIEKHLSKIRDLLISDGFSIDEYTIKKDKYTTQKNSLEIKREKLLNEQIHTQNTQFKYNT